MSRFGYLQDKISNNEIFTIKDIYQCIDSQWFRFNKSAFRKKLNFNNVPFKIIKVAEPHKKDGVRTFARFLYIVLPIWFHFLKSFIKILPSPAKFKTFG